MDGSLAVKSGLRGKYIQYAGGLSQAFGLYRRVARCLDGPLEKSQDHLSVLDACGLQFCDWKLVIGGTGAPGCNRILSLRGPSTG